MLRTWLRRLPPLAWRDTALRELRETTRQLTRQNRELQARSAEQQDRLRRPRDGWTPPSTKRAVELIRASGLFAPDWYLAQLPPEQVPDAEADPATHFLVHGDHAGLSPHPLFLPSYYVGQGSDTANVRRQVRRRPFLHYLDLGAAAGRSPHPLFDAEKYLAAHADSRSEPGGPLAHFLARGRPLDVAAGATGQRWDDPGQLLSIAQGAAEQVLATRGYETVDRDRKSFDADLAARVAAELRAVPLPPDPPTVSIILPTKDRADMLGAALDSVLAQSYPHWQLIVVDDGSQDETSALLERYTPDERVEVVRHDLPRGVAAARNAGLRRATGRYVAYLDSDNTWEPDFLDLMVRHLLRSGDRVAYGVTELVEEGGQQRVLYRGLPFDRDHLRERNYIDCIVVVHERSLLDLTGGFDETLRRNVDWDLLIRMAEHTDFTLVPVIVTRYDPWSTQGERITTQEPMAYRYVVRQRTLVDLDAVARSAADRDPELLSVVLALGEDDEARRVVGSVRRLQETAAGRVEIVIMDARTRPEVFAVIYAHLADVPDVRLRRLPQALPAEVPRNVGLATARGRDVLFLSTGLWAEPLWDSPIRRALGTHRVVQPLILTSAGTVWSAGVEYTPDGHRYLPWTGFAGDAPEVREVREVAAVSAAALAVRAVDLATAGGFNPLVRDEIHGGEAAVRIRRHTGGTAACVPASVLSWNTPVPAPRSPRETGRMRANRRSERELVREAGLPPRNASAAMPGYRIIGFERTSPQEAVPRPLVVHERPSRALRWALKIGADDVETRESWGDWHFARSLKDSLERLGHDVSIDIRRAWYRPTAHLDDVVVQLRGVSRYEVNPSHTNVIWVISHPDRVGPAELADYDVAYGASPRWSRAMTRRLGRPVETLLQCTDHRRFHPVDPDPVRRHDVLAVANARGPRPAVAAALEAGLVPAVYGLRWDGLLPPGAWQGTYLPNADLPAVYRAAGVVLNDHWEDMREHGLLSNRLFDLTACEARVVSDHLPEIAEVFGDVVLTYGEGRSIDAAVQQQLSETPERARSRRELGARVRAEHTFDARAEQLVKAVLALRAEHRETRSS